ncbi:MAG: ThiF family adenylyltransferase [Capsulimonadaceae bacterium]
MEERFRRHEQIDGWSQTALAEARVIVVGMGALGNEAARVLAMAGVGSMVLCDPDRVEESNLSRMSLFGVDDVGRLKVDAAADGLRRLAPSITLDTRPLPLVHGVGLAELRDADLTLSCLDSRSARLQLAGRCNLVRARVIDGGTHPWGGEVRPYLDPDGPCYGCALSEAQRGTADAPWSCLDVAAESGPAAIPSSALVGVWMATVAIRALMGLPCPSGLLLIDTVRGVTSVVEMSRDASCLLHERTGEIRPIDVTVDGTVAELLAALSPHAVPLAWTPVQYRSDCLACGHTEPHWGLPERAPCPRCGKPLLPRTTLELSGAPGDMTLRALGIAPREVLAVRTGDGMDWVELRG